MKWMLEGQQVRRTVLGQDIELVTTENFHENIRFLDWNG